MKLINSFIIIGTLLNSILHAQNLKSIDVLYESYVKFDNIENEDLENDINKALKRSMIKPAYYRLKSTERESFFEFEERVQNEQDVEKQHMSISTAAPLKLYKNIIKKQSLMEFEAFNKKLILTDSLKSIHWYKTTERKNSLGYSMTKATAELDSITNLTAWYSNDILIKNGPENYQGLPGLILEIEIKKNNHLQEIITYKAIEINENGNFIISIPKRGKKISKENFIKLQNEYFEKVKDFNSNKIDLD